MTDQTAIPVDESQPASAPCEWCGETAYQQITTEKARYRNDRGVHMVAKPARRRWVCDKHYASLAPQVEGLE